MQLIDSIYATSSPNEKNQSNSPTSAVLTGYAPPSIFSTDGYYADSYEKAAISPLKIVDLDASIVRPPSEIESNRIERTRLQNAQNQTRGTHRRLPESVKHYLDLLFCGIGSMSTRILIAAGVAAILLLGIIFVSIFGPISSPRIEISRSVQFKTLKGSNFITETPNRLVLDGSMVLKTKIFNKNHLQMLIERIQVHGYYVIKGAQRQSLKRNYIASGSISVMDIGARNQATLQIPMEIRYTSGKPSSSLLLDFLERYETEKPVDMLFSFEVNYRVGGRSRKTSFSGRQSFDFPFTDSDIRTIKKNR